MPARSILPSFRLVMCYGCASARMNSAQQEEQGHPDYYITSNANVPILTNAASVYPGGRPSLSLVDKGPAPWVAACEAIPNMKLMKWHEASAILHGGRKTVNKNSLK